MDHKRISFNEIEMQKYYIEFDPIKKKYGMILKRASTVNEAEEWYEDFRENEDNYQFGELTKKQFGDIQENLDMIYSDEEKTDIMLDVYDLVCQKVINQYLNIDGIERLFSDKYINFEWEMHLGMNYKIHQMDYYRDHFIHQIRDAFSMDILLQNGFLGKIKDILGEKGNSKISRYVCKYINQQLEHVNSIISKCNLEKELQKEFYLENIIYFSSYMAGLFHDIGYPQCAHMKSGRNIREYITNVYHFGTGVYDFDRITSMLQNSLLFRVVSCKEIKSRIEGEKIDHGAVSALMFLLHFYENGAIYGLEPYKRCSVELAALAIYNHTNKYSYVEESTQLYERSVFNLNPISYLLRICDDLQEWERIYFEISDKANLILCNKCRTPLVRKKLKSARTVFYDCMCNRLDKSQIEQKEKQMKFIDLEEAGIFSAIFKRQNFPYRRMHNMVVCENMVLHVKDSEKYIFELDYSLEKLLNIVYITTSFSKYRISELNKLKKLFVRQCEIGQVYLNYFVTPNVLLIKAKIVSEYLNRCKKSLPSVETLDVERIMDSKVFDYKTKLSKVHLILSQKSEELYKVFSWPKEIGSNRTQKDRAKKYLAECFKLYIYIALVMQIGKYKNNITNKEKRDLYNKIIDDLWEEYKSGIIWSDDVGILFKDCCMQAKRMYDDLTSISYYPEDYMKQYDTEDKVYRCMNNFIDSDRYQPLNKRGNIVLDAYTDLYYFKIMLSKLRQN